MPSRESRTHVLKFLARTLICMMKKTFFSISVSTTIFRIYRFEMICIAQIHVDLSLNLYENAKIS